MCTTIKKLSRLSTKLKGLNQNLCSKSPACFCFFDFLKINALLPAGAKNALLVVINGAGETNLVFGNFSKQVHFSI